MAEIKSASKKGVVSVLEDINPNNSTIYLEGEAHDRTTLAPIFNSAMYMYAGEPQVNTYGNNIYRSDDGNTYNLRSGDGAGTLALGKECAYSMQSVLTGGDRTTNVPFLHVLSMDETVRGAPMHKVTADDGTVLNIWELKPMFYNWYRQISWLNPSKELYEQSPSNSFGYDGQGSSSEITVPEFATVEEAGTKWVSNICQRIRYDSYTCRPMFGLGRNEMQNYGADGITYGTTLRDRYVVQFIGQSSVDGKPIYMYNHLDSDYRQYITKHNVSLNTTTDLHTFHGVPAAGTTNYGGARTNSTMGWMNMWSSKTFDDPTSAGNKCFYTPYFDANLNYHPFFYQWDVATDTFVRNEDVVITGDLSTNHINNHSTAVPNHAGMNSNMYNETFVSNGNRYLTIVPMHGQYQVHDSVPQARTILTYAVDAADPKSLTHHSAVTIPATIRNMVFLNDARTMMGCIGENAIYILNWNNVDGWVLTTTYTGKFTGLGRDTTDRIWATEVSGDDSYASIHIITPSIPVKISITPAETSYNYTGSDINTTINIGAYNSNGDRIAVGVSLSIDGTTMNFNGSSTATVTTSASADVSQAVTITGAGLSDIIASVQI